MSGASAVSVYGTGSIRSCCYSCARVGVMRSERGERRRDRMHTVSQSSERGSEVANARMSLFQRLERRERKTVNATFNERSRRRFEEDRGEGGRRRRGKVGISEKRWKYAIEVYGTERRVIYGERERGRAEEGAQTGTEEGGSGKKGIVREGEGREKVSVEEKNVNRWK